MARLDRGRVVETDIATRRVTIDKRARRPAQIANDNHLSAGGERDRLWPLATALLVLAWALLSVSS